MRFLLNYKMTTIIRGPPSSASPGRILGVTANYTPRYAPGSTTPLQSYYSSGNINETTPTLNIAAAKAVIIGTGGCAGNVNLRRIFDPRLTEEIAEVGPPYCTHSGEGILAAQAVGAQLWGTCGQTITNRNVSRRTVLGMGYAQAFGPGSPQAAFQRAIGLTMTSWQDAILVNMAGNRFCDETNSGPAYIAGNTGQGSQGTTNELWFDQSMAQGGPIWAIFDSAGAKREKFNLAQGSVDIAGGYFFSASTLDNLANQIVPPNGAAPLPPYTIPMPAAALDATVARYNSFVTSGNDSDFGKPTPQYPIATPPFYAAFASDWIHETSVGLHINPSAQVLDQDQGVITGLYAGGEALGGLTIHGQGKALLFGRLAAKHAYLETPWTHP